MGKTIPCRRGNSYRDKSVINGELFLDKHFVQFKLGGLPMVDTVNQALVTQFTDMVAHKAQQTESFFRGRVMQKPVKGKKFDYQNLGSAEVKTVNSRHEQVVAGNPQHTRRGAIIKTYYENWLFDKNDDLQSLIELESPYVEALAKSMARQYDHVVADAALGAVLTGENLTTSTVFSSDEGQTVTAASGLTYDKLREVLEKFYSRGIGLSAAEKLYIAMTEKEHSTLLDQVEVISADYRDRGDLVVEKGRVTKVLGMNVIVFPSTPLTGQSIINAQSASINNCFAFSMDGICVGINSEIDIVVEPRYDLVDSKQVKAIFRLGALRTEGSRVVKIDVTNV